MDYSIYSNQPGFNASQTSKVRRYQSFLKKYGDHDRAKSVRKRLNALYSQRKEARSNYAKSRPYGEGSLRNYDVDQQVIGAVRTKYGHEIDASPERQKQIKGYYDNWNRELGNLRTQQAQQAQAVIDSANTNINNMQTSQQNANAGLLEKMQADAAARGATIDPSLFLKANAASAQRATQAGLQTNTLAANQQANDAYMGKQAQTMLGLKQGALDKENAYTGKLRTDAADYARGVRQDLDNTSWDRALGVKTLGVKVAQNQASNDIAWAKINAKGSDSGGSGGSGGSDDSDGVKLDKDARTRYWKATGLANDAVSRGKLKKGKGAKYESYLVQKRGYDQLLAHAATLKALWGGVDRKTRTQVYNRYGFYLPLSKTEKKKKK